MKTVVIVIVRDLVLGLESFQLKQIISQRRMEIIVERLVAYQQMAFALILLTISSLVAAA